MEQTDATVWTLTVKYPVFLPTSSDADEQTGDPRVSPLAISRIGNSSTCLSVSVAASSEGQAREIGLAGLEHWAQRLGIRAENPVVLSLFAND